MKGNKTHSNIMYIHTHTCKLGMKARGESQEVQSPKNTKNAPQIITEGREKEPRSGGATACSSGVATRWEFERKGQGGDGHGSNRQTPQGKGREARERKRHQGSAMDSPE